MNIKKREWAVLILCSSGITALSLFPFREVPFDTAVHWDKAAHFIMYFVLAVSSMRTFSLNSPKRSRIYALVYVFFLGMSLELIQYKLPYRSFEWYDLLADLLGGTAAVWAARHAVFRKFACPDNRPVSKRDRI